MKKIIEALSRSVIFVLAFALGMLTLALIVSMRLKDSGADPLACLGAFCTIAFIGAVPALKGLNTTSQA
jgi:hypothetical protein